MDIATLQIVDQWNKRMDQLDSMTNNLTNATSLGYKSFRMHFTKIVQPSPEPGALEYEYLPKFQTDFSQGPIQMSGNPLDAAIEGDGFFAIETPSGTAYTRQGSFSVNKTGEMVNGDGDAVLGASGRKITVSGAKVEIGGEGNILVDGRKTDKLKIVTFTDADKLERLPGCKFRDPGTAGITEVKTPSVHAEHVETSNVNVVSEMVQMIHVQRMIEFYQKNMQSISELDRLSSSRIGRLYS